MGVWDADSEGEDEVRQAGAWKPMRNSASWAAFWRKEVNLSYE